MGGAVIVFILEVMEALIKGMGLPWYVVVIIGLGLFYVIAWLITGKDQAGKEHAKKGSIIFPVG